MGYFDDAAIGTVSNVASRLCDEAKSGQILISPRVLTAIGDAVAVELIGEFALKGIQRPPPALRCIGRQACKLRRGPRAAMSAVGTSRCFCEVVLTSVAEVKPALSTYLSNGE